MVVPPRPPARSEPASGTERDPPPSAGPESGARPSWAGVSVRLAWVAALVALDLWSKSQVFGWLGPRPEGLSYDAHGHPRWELLGDWFAFMLSWNPGMAWGFDFIPPPLLVSGRALAVLLLLWLLVRAERGRALLTTSLGLILAGAAGNLWDNLSQGNLLGRAAGEPLRVGMVRDFIDLYFALWDWHFPTFNVADSCITVGGLLLVGSSLLMRGGASEGPRCARA